MIIYIFIMESLNVKKMSFEELESIKFTFGSNKNKTIKEVDSYKHLNYLYWVVSNIDEEKFDIVKVIKEYLERKELIQKQKEKDKIEKDKQEMEKKKKEQEQIKNNTPVPVAGTEDKPFYSHMEYRLNNFIESYETLQRQLKRYISEYDNKNNDEKQNTKQLIINQFKNICYQGVYDLVDMKNISSFYTNILNPKYEYIESQLKKNISLQSIISILDFTFENIKVALLC